MPSTTINPTRMELTRLKGRLKTAQRGHKLLKDKRDELMKQFMDVVRENRALRRRVEEGLMQASQLLAQEIERTRRRVNALEYVKIPQMEESIHYISMKLDENERANTIRLMKVKDLLLKESIEARREQDAQAMDAFRNSAGRAAPV